MNQVIRLKLNWEKEYLKSINKGLESTKYMKEDEILTGIESDLILSPSTSISLIEFLNNKEIQKNKYLKSTNDRSLSSFANEKNKTNKTLSEKKLKNDTSLNKVDEESSVIDTKEDIKIDVSNLIDNAAQKLCYPQSKYMPTLIEEEEEEEEEKVQGVEKTPVKKDYIKLFNLTVEQYNFVFDFFKSYSKNNKLDKHLVHSALMHCVNHRKDLKKSLENEINRIILKNKKNNEFELDEFIEFICLLFARKNNINSTLMSILKNRYSIMSNKVARKFASEIFDYFGINKTDLVLKDKNSFEDISSDISEHIQNFLYF